MMPTCKLKKKMFEHMKKFVIEAIGIFQIIRHRYQPYLVGHGLCNHMAHKSNGPYN
jgi:hypothetical protein